jgi:DNA-binding transcriptional ArsR family regulator
MRDDDGDRPAGEQPDAFRQCLDGVCRHVETVGGGLAIAVPLKDRNGDKYSAQDRILLYLIAVLRAFKYANAVSAGVSDHVLWNQLGMEYETLRPRLKELRDQGLVRSTQKGRYVTNYVAPTRIRAVLKRIDTDYAGRWTPGETFKTMATVEARNHLVLDKTLPVAARTRVEVAVTIPDEQATEKT